MVSVLCMCCSFGVGPFVLVVNSIAIGIGAGVFVCSSFDVMRHCSAGVVVCAHATISTPVK